MPARLIAFPVMLLLFASISQAQDTKGKDDKSDSTIDSNTLQTGEYIGKLLAPPGSDGLFSLRIDYYVPKDAAAAKKAADQLNNLVQQARNLEQQVSANPTQQRITSLQQAYDRVRKEQAKQRDLYNIASKDIEFHSANNLIVRYLTPPVVYDDKGERKKYTSIELREMRGYDLNVPGFEAKASDLQTNQIVRISLRPAKATSTATTTSDKTKPETKMEATMAVIVVAEDMTAVPQDSKDQPKKKKGK